jgi:RNA polymerase sigma-70 factor, ECF subfamily
MDEFRDIYERHYSAVYRLALFLTGDSNLAEDLTADTFVRAWTARDRLRVQTVRAYLLTITRNLHRDQHRRREARFVELDVAPPDGRPDAECRAEQSSNVRALRSALPRSRPTIGARCCSTPSATCRTPRLLRRSGLASRP